MDDKLSVDVENLERTQYYLNHIIAMGIIGIYDEVGEALYVLNDEFLKMGGYCERAVFFKQYEGGLQSLLVQSDDKSIKKFMRSDLAEGQTFADIVQMKTAKGVLWINYHAKRVRVAENKMVNMYSCYDVTTNHMKEELYRESLREALEASKQGYLVKEQFLARMSYGLKTPLNAIIGLTSLSEISDKMDVSMTMKRISASAHSQLAMVNDILDLSRIESGKISFNVHEFDFREVIYAVDKQAHKLAKLRGVRYESVVLGEIADFYNGDADKLGKLLTILLNFAVQHAKKDGEVHFLIQQYEKMNRNRTLRFIIQNEGYQVQPNVVEHMFEPFSDIGGDEESACDLYDSGIGLAVANNLAKMMDGKIEVQTNLGRGTNFIVEIKLGMMTDWKPIQRTLADGMQKKLVVLVVDDNEVICQSTCEKLRQVGVQAESSLVKEEIIPKSRGQFDILWINDRVRNCSGADVARKLQRMFNVSDFAVAMMGYDDEDCRGVDVVVKKPLFQSVCFQTLEALYAAKTVERAERRNRGYDFKNLRILVVDDQAMNIEVMRGLLQHKGVVVEIATNGLFALGMVEKSAEKYYDLILMDITMPIMDGWAATKAIRELSRTDVKTMPIIAMTANTLEDDFKKSFDSGIDTHLCKPIEYRELYIAIQTLLNCKGR